MATYLCSMKSKLFDDKDIEYRIRQLKQQIKNNSLNKSVIEFLLEKRNKLFSSLIDLNSELIETETIIQYYDSKNSDTSLIQIPEIPKYQKKEQTHSYRTKKFWRTISMDILEKEDKYLSSSQILASVDVPIKENRQCMSILSIVLNEFCSENRIVRIKVDKRRGYYYALKGTPFILKE